MSHQSFSPNIISLTTSSELSIAIEAVSFQVLGTATSSVHAARTVAKAICALWADSFSECEV